MIISYERRYVSWLHEIRSRELESIIKALPVRRFEAILELGCGDGFQSMKLKPLGKLLVSTDYRFTALNRRQSNNLNFVVCDAEQLPFKPGSFDAVFSSNMLEHLEDIDRALKEMTYVLRPRGMMLHAVPNVTWKVLQLVLHYPFVVFLELNKLAGRFKRVSTNVDSDLQKREDSNVKTQRGSKALWQRLLGRCFPSVHGIGRGHIDELYRFSDLYWQRVFRRNGLISSPVKPQMPLYSAYGFGFTRLRKVGELFGLSSCNCYVLQTEVINSSRLVENK
jgi:2-polyprenyl-3-methyl-5-hydroxy-6-metoxy-1,4-benzoquinol methylase